MTHFSKFENLKIQLFKIIFFLSFIAIWTSVSSKFEDLLIFKDNKNLNFIDLINFLRHLSVYIILLFSIVIIFKNQIKTNNLEKTLTLYFISQCVGLFFTNNSIENLSFSISCISFIFLLTVLRHYLKSTDYRLIVLIMMMILVSVVILSFTPNLISFFTGQSKLYGANYSESILFFNKESPRSSGISRSLLAILLLNFFYKNNYKSENLFIATNTLIIFFIFLNQSRLIIFLTIISLLSILVIEKENNFINILKQFFFYIIIPVILFYSSTLIYYKNYTNLEIKNLENFNYNKSVLEKKIQAEKEIKKKYIREINFDNFTSGRFEDWKLLFNKFQSKNILYGYGALGDRYLINQSASNGFIYAFVSSGIIGTILFIISSLLIFFTVIKKLFFFTNGNSFQTKILSILVIIILLRSILEVSYAVFGLDFLILYTTFTMLQKRNPND